MFISIVLKQKVAMPQQQIIRETVRVDCTFTYYMFAGCVFLFFSQPKPKSVKTNCCVNYVLKSVKRLFIHDSVTFFHMNFILLFCSRFFLNGNILMNQEFVEDTTFDSFEDSSNYCQMKS